jgi:hypothetical protein
VLSISSSLLMLTPRSPSITSCPHTFPLPQRHSTRSIFVLNDRQRRAPAVHPPLQYNINPHAMHLRRRGWARTRSAYIDETAADKDAQLRERGEAHHTRGRNRGEPALLARVPAPVLACVLAGCGAEPNAGVVTEQALAWASFTPQQPRSGSAARSAPAGSGGLPAGRPAAT